ncbi:Protein of unknown function [Escherichia coli]|nr:Protein of unknown function [Escherichia coli]CDU38833.1 Protein of unknown function [Escherichia coli]
MTKTLKGTENTLREELN